MSRSARIEYQPALDGVRALAVIAVLLFHAATPGFDGGYLGVSVFFTLSGYLITSLLVNEYDATSGISLGNFYGRRIRRLLPASVLTLAIVVVLAGVTDLFEAVANLRGDVLGSLFQVQNWVLLAGGGSYQDLLADTSGTPSPLEHFWSLAIEEQFYWVWPLVMLLLLRRVAPGRGRIAWIGGLTAVACIAAPLIAQVWGPDAAYWATPARLGEILIGAFLAVVLSGRAVDRRLGVLAPIGLLALAASVVLFPAASGPAYEGALPLVALASGALLLGLQVDSPLTRALAVTPLVAIGRISYGVYLFHWPIYVIVDADRFGHDGPLLTIVRLALTAVAAVASYFLIEQPIRRLPRPAFTRTALVGGATVMVVAVTAVVVVPAAIGDYWTVDDDVAEAASINVTDEAPLTAVAPADSAAPTETSSPAVPTTAVVTAPRSTTDTPVGVAQPTTTTSTTSTTEPPLPVLARPVRIVVTGDSTAEALGAGVITWAAAHPELAQVEVEAAPGCGFVTGGDRKRGDGVESSASCDGWVESELVPVVERVKPDVVAVMVTTWDVIGRRWSTQDLLSPTDGEYRLHIEAGYRALVDELAAAGAPQVALIRQPVPDVWWLPLVQEEDQPARHQVIYDVYDELDADYPGFVTVVPFDQWFSDQGFDRDELVRPDGVHLAPESAEAVTTDYLGERLVRAALGLAAQR